MKGASTVNRGTAIGLLNMFMTAPQARNPICISTPNGMEMARLTPLLFVA